jgi:phosphoribosyl-AMP cyclohydrolase
MTDIKFDASGLVPGVVQDAHSGQVLMVGYLNEESLALTRATGRVHFWSRSRRELWEKGATSGNYLNVVDIALDCDADALLITAEPEGPACHTGAVS